MPDHTITESEWLAMFCEKDRYTARTPVEFTFDTPTDNPLETTPPMAKHIYYISVPMKDRQRADIQADIDRLADLISRKRTDWTAIFSPYDVNSFCHLPDDLTYGQYVGHDTTFIIDHADAVVFDRNWQQSDGCNSNINAPASIKSKSFTKKNCNNESKQRTLLYPRH